MLCYAMLYCTILISYIILYFHVLDKRLPPMRGCRAGGHLLLQSSLFVMLFFFAFIVYVFIVILLFCLFVLFPFIHVSYCYQHHCYYDICSILCSYYTLFSVLVSLIILSSRASPLQDSRLFGPGPWKILATTYDKQRFLSNPAPGENLLSGNLVKETGCIAPTNFLAQ